VLSMSTRRGWCVLFRLVRSTLDLGEWIEVCDVQTCQGPPIDPRRGSVPAAPGTPGPSRHRAVPSRFNDHGVGVWYRCTGDRTSGGGRPGHRPVRDPRVQRPRLAVLAPRWGPGRPRRITDEDIQVIVAAATTRPKRLGLPFTHWSIRKLTAYVNGRYGHHDPDLVPARAVRIGRERVRGRPAPPRHQLPTHPDLEDVHRPAL
jgi:Homeodomain-like domain